MKTFAWVPLLSLVAVGCGDTGGGDGGMDQGVALDGGDLATGNNDLSGLQCAATDPMGDGADCSGTFSCPAGQVCVSDNGSSSSYHCKYKCNDSAGNVIPALCPCDRACLTLTNDGGVVGAGCILGNTAGERCGTSFGTGDCAQNTFCAGQAMSAPAYCLWTCTSGGNECPLQTTCQQVFDDQNQPIGFVCAYNYPAPGQPGGIAGGAACASLNDTCATGYVCDGTKCQLQCNGPGDDGAGKTCTIGTCTAVNDPAKSKIIAYVCK